MPSILASKVETCRERVIYVEIMGKDRKDRTRTWVELSDVLAEDFSTSDQAELRRWNITRSELLNNFNIPNGSSSYAKLERLLGARGLKTESIPGMQTKRIVRS